LITPDEVLRQHRFLLDTNVISHLIRPKRGELHPGIRRFFEEVDEDRMYLSVFTVGEIQKGIDLLPWPKSQGEEMDERTRLQATLEQRLEALCDRFDGRIIEFDARVARQYGHLHAATQRVGRTTPLMDTLIAACAVLAHLTIVTADGDFALFESSVTVYNLREHSISGFIPHR
jgi:hypothetical protein